MPERGHAKPGHMDFSLNNNKLRGITIANLSSGMGDFNKIYC
jgi:hypothetical protein